MPHNATLKKVVTTGTSTVMGLSILAGLASPSHAAFPDGYDPVASGCNDGTTLATAYGSSPNFGQVSVELRMSSKCKANWVKGYVPRSTSLYLKGQQNQIYVPYTTTVNGSSYANMMNWNPPYKACAKLPNGTEVCTPLIP
jgi:hypothetical protein